MSKIKKQIAVVGAGFSGLALCWYLLNLDQPPHVTLISHGQEASRISAGILHKYMGLYAKLNPLAKAAERETVELMAEMQKFSTKPIILSKGLIRLALTEKQRLAYQICAEKYEDVEWLETCQSLDPHTPPVPGIFIESGLTIDTQNYLNTLLSACKNKGLKEEYREVKEELKNFDHVVYAMGPHIKDLEPFKHLPLHAVRGQLIEIEWPKNLPPLPYTLVSQIYIAMTQDYTKAVIGATYEHLPEPDPDFAVKTLLPKATELYPPLANAKILAIKSAYRATTPNRLPMAQILNSKCSILAGMGSRGLLYHAHFAKALAYSLPQ